MARQSRISPSGESISIPSAYTRKSRLLSRHLLSALDGLHKSRSLRTLFGDAFVDIFVTIKRAEYAAQARPLSPWELDHLINNV
ncbi:MAG: hypothetical protein V3R27_11170 [Pseudomonadales bacterium]